MNGIEAIAAATPVTVSPSDAIGLAQPGASVAGAPDAARVGAFGDLLARGLSQAEQKVDAADALVRAFAVDDAVPIHHVTIALEEARLAVDMAMQVRTRLVEAYREIMNTQL